MPTGKRKGRPADRNQATGLRFDKQRLIISFTDGREMAVPLTFYPSLLRATTAQRRKWELIGPGKGFCWKELDLDLSVDGLVQGLREAIPRPPARVAAVEPEVSMLTSEQRKRLIAEAQRLGKQLYGKAAPASELAKNEDEDLALLVKALRVLANPKTRRTVLMSR